MKMSFKVGEFGKNVVGDNFHCQCFTNRCEGLKKYLFDWENYVEVGTYIGVILTALDLNECQKGTLLVGVNL